MKTMLASGQVSLAGAMAGFVYATQDPLAGGNEGGYGTTSGLDHVVKAKISEVVRPFFKKFDQSVMGTSTRVKSRQYFTIWARTRRRRRWTPSLMN